MSERDRLIEELERKLSNPTSPEEIADFILADRKRIIENIKYIRKEINELILPTNKEKRLIKYCDETLRNAGVEV